MQLSWHKQVLSGLIRVFSFFLFSFFEFLTGGQTLFSRATPPEEFQGSIDQNSDPSTSQTKLSKSLTARRQRGIRGRE
ncbi:hypothetical protein BY996DRAFT_7211901 [Phakopsora pachyrhizi]|nr:hypothetical protein BY996DRAFT_7211901 [Phakopsora pachyrhizi]